MAEKNQRRLLALEEAADADREENQAGAMVRCRIHATLTLCLKTRGGNGENQ